MPKLGYIGLKIRYDSRDHSGPACVQTPFLPLKLIKNYLDLINHTRLGEASAKPNPALPWHGSSYIVVGVDEETNLGDAMLTQMVLGGCG